MTKQALTPKNEAERLELLRELEILDTLEEQGYDDLTRLAALICDAPISLVSLVDKDRQWFKSRHGLNATETPRNIAFCSYAILESKTFYVPNADEDKRFFDNPLVKSDPNVKFYAGVPLELEPGVRLGTLCVIDTKPRELSNDQLEALECLARQVTYLLDLRLKNSRLNQIKDKQNSSLKEMRGELETKKMLERTQEAAKIGSWHVDIKSNKCYWSSMTYKIHEEDPSKKIFVEDGINYYSQEYRSVIQECLEQAIRDGKDWDEELQIITAKGKLKWVRAIGHPVLVDNELVLIEGTFQDISTRKENDEKTENLNRRLTLALKASGVGVWEWNLITNELIWDKQMYNLYGIKESDFEGAYMAWERGLHPDDRESSSALIRLATEGKAKFDTEFRVLRPSGNIRNIRALADVVYDDEDRPIKMIGVNWDITESVHTKAQLAEEKERAEQLLQVKSAFLANMSHEIRTPLNGIVGFTQLLAQKNLPEEVSNYVGYIKSSSESLLVIINDILDVSKIESGKLKIENVPFSLKKKVEASIKNFEASVLHKNISLSYKVSDEVPEVLSGDPFRLKQILLNLIGNAIKFTEKGSILVEVDVSKKLANDFFELLFKVTDTGVGIACDSVEKLFKNFEQADSSITRKYGGTGLGLSICASLVNLMGGEISVKSNVGEGSVVSFTIVAEKNGLSTDSDRQNTTQESTDSLEFNKNIKILVAEDNKINQIMFGEVLKKAGYQSVDFVENGQEAVDAASSKSYDVIFMDVQMPKMDGYTATKMIKEQATKSLPIIGLSANVFKEEKERGIQSGMDDYLEKPINTEKLMQVLSQLK